MTKQQKINQLEADLKYWKDRAIEAEEKVEEFEVDKKLKSVRLDAGENKHQSDMERENEKLWYMLRHLTNDHRILTKVKDSHIQGNPEFEIDPFPGARSPNPCRF